MKKSILLLFVLIIALLTNAQDVVEFGVTYKADFARNFDGGIKQGNAYMGLISLNSTINTNGGQFYIDIQNTHGSLLSGDYVGDLQYVSNIEHGLGFTNYTYMHQLWYKHKINNSELLIGVHDMNSLFLASNNAGHFFNASFGIMPTVSCNIPTSIFPITTLGAVFTQSINDVDIMLGLYNGNPYFYSNKYGFDKFYINNEFLSIAEIQFNTISTKIGSYYHSNDINGISDTTENYNGNYGFYLITDQVLYKINDNRNISSFLKFGFAPTDRNTVSSFIGGGVVFNGTFLKRDNDIIGVAFAYNKFNSFYDDYENTIECFYQYNISSNIMIQPEVQYVMSPNLNSGLGNAFVGLVRLVVSLPQFIVFKFTLNLNYLIGIFCFYKKNYYICREFKINIMKNLTSVIEIKDITSDITKVITIGLNMQCKNIVASGELTYTSDGWVLKSGGMKIKMYLSDLDTMWLDTPQNRKELKHTL